MQIGMGDMTEHVEDAGGAGRKAKEERCAYFPEEGRDKEK